MLGRTGAWLLAGALAAAAVGACDFGDARGDGDGGGGGTSSGTGGSPTLLDEIAAYQDLPSSDLGRRIAAGMAEDGDVRWVPWLVDLLRFGGSTQLEDDAAAAMTTLTGVTATGERVADLRGFGSWMYDERIDPGRGYREWKSALMATIDDDLAILVSQVDDPVVLARLQWGGVVRGGIPELNDPPRYGPDAPEAAYLVGDELVLGAEIEGTPVAYPVRVLGHHEMANDTIAGRPVTLAYCTLCRTAVLYDRTVDGQVLELETSGMLLNSNKVMVDRQTDTLWNHLTGEAFAGALVGAHLVALPVVTTTWSDWVATHPDTEVIGIPDPVVFDDPERPPISYDYTPGAAYASYYESDELWFPTLATPDAFALKAEVVTVEHGGATLAVSLDALHDAGAVAVTAGDATLVVVPAGAGARVYDATGTGVRRGEPVALATEQAGVSSVALADGTVLPRVVSGQSFWFAWYGAHPGTDWWPRWEG